MDTLNPRNPGSSKTTLPSGTEIHTHFTLTCDHEGCSCVSQSFPTGPTLARAAEYGLTTDEEIQTFLLNQLRQVALADGWGSVTGYKDGVRRVEDYCPDHISGQYAMRKRVVRP